MSSDEGGVRSVSSSVSTRRLRLSRSGATGRRAAALAADGRASRFRFSFFRATFFLIARRADARAVLARLTTARLRPLVLDFVLFWARRLTLRRTRFAMTKIPFKSLTGFG